MNINRKELKERIRKTREENISKMKAYSLLRLALFIFVFSTLVFVATAAITYTITRDKAMKGANILMNQNMALATEIINRHLQSVENSGYSLASILLKKKVAFDEDGNPYPIFIFNGTMSDRMSEEELYAALEKFVKANPHLWGAAIGFEPYIYPERGDKGLAPFVRHTNDTLYEHLSLPDMRNNYRDADWYKTTKELGKPRWSLPFVDVKGEVISCFCIPLYAPDGKTFIGAIAVDMMLKGFSNDLKREICPYEGSEVMVIGSGNKFLVHPDQSYVMNRSIESIESLKEEYKDKDATLFYHTIEPSKVTVAVSCPDKAIYKSFDELTDKLMWFAGIGLLVFEICCMTTFKQVRRVAEDKASIEGELNVASNIQKSMLPMMFPAFPDRKDIDLYATQKPAKMVGGDLYDYVISKNEAGEDTLVFTIGDVSGKGVPASLLMAVVCSLFRNTAMKTTDPKAIATDLNNCISERNEYNMFCTMFIGSLNLASGSLSFCNAGHNQPVLINDGKASFVEVIPNIPIGTFDGFEFESETMQMEIGDTLFIYTDGVTEAENTQHNEYSDERLIEVLNTRIGVQSASIIETVAQSLKEFVGKAEQSDDITMLAVRRN